MNNQYFKGSLDALARNLTIALTVLFASMVVFHIGVVNDTGKTASLFVIILLLVIYLSSYLFHPQGYIVTKDAVIIKRTISPVTKLYGVISYRPSRWKTTACQLQSVCLV